MEHYIPDSILLNNIYLPFYIDPTKKVLNCDKDLTIESDSLGIKSVINMNGNLPFINISCLDSESKDWLWYDSDGFPFRIEKNITLNCWQLISLYNIGTNKDNILKINPNKLSYDSNGKHLGFYTVVENYIVNNILYNTSSEIKMYIGQQIFVEIEGSILTDKSNYINTQNDIQLTKLNSDLNKEFYYNYTLNKIYTNQNLQVFDLVKINIYMYTMIQEASVKCNLMSNYGSDNYITPIVDYYIVKLHGQTLG